MADAPTGERRTGRRVVNLTFHGIGTPLRPVPPEEAAIWSETSRYESILDAVQARDDVTLSFDDGNASDIEVGLPALLERGLRARFYVVAAWLDVPAFLTSEDVRRLVDANMEIGLHGFSHRAWRHLDDDALHHELHDAKARLEDVSGQPVRTAACPGGAYDRRVLRALAKAGCERVFTSDDGAADADAWLQPRNSVRATDDATVVDRILAADRRPATRLMFAAKRAVKRWR